jgi:hypothetical protein
MKTEKKSVATAKDKNKNKTGSVSQNEEVKPGTSSGKTGATGRIRANSGTGLSNEGTTTSYEDQNRNG